MCLITLAWRPDHHLALVVAANRDEFFARPTEPAHWWNDNPDIFAGRDLSGYGTWMGVTQSGRFAALTNYRAPGEKRTDAPSRGRLVSDFLSGSASVDEFLDSLAETENAYNGFNLIVAEGLGDATRAKLRIRSNRGTPGSLVLAPGVHGLSNASLDDPWPKVIAARRSTECALAESESREELFERLFDMLADRSIAPDAILPATGVALEWERALSAAYIALPDYGTRTSTVLALDRDGNVEFEERTVGGPGAPDTRRVGFGMRQDPTTGTTTGTARP